LPALFQDLHKQAEQEYGDELPFLTWMADHATDEQLLNVWQWHDAYLDNLDTDSTFQERIHSIKSRHLEGFSMQSPTKYCTLL